MTFELATDSSLTRSHLTKLARCLSLPCSTPKIAERLGASLDRLYGQQDDNDPVAIVRTKNGKPADPTTVLARKAFDLRVSVSAPPWPDQEGSG